MTDTIDVPRGYHIAARWRVLAEKRLAYITELYESGRWKKFHTEAEFTAIVRAAKAGVEVWHQLAPPPILPVRSTIKHEVIEALPQEAPSMLPPSPFEIRPTPPLQPSQPEI
jgi:uncharacterized repeat protein (TIGR03809 family)